MRTIHNPQIQYIALQIANKLRHIITTGLQRVNVQCFGDFCASIIKVESMLDIRSNSVTRENIMVDPTLEARVIMLSSYSLIKRKILDAATHFTGKPDMYVYFNIYPDGAKA
jgi:hypothetical protein